MMASSVAVADTDTLEINIPKLTVRYFLTIRRVKAPLLTHVVTGIDLSPQQPKWYI